MAKLPTVTLKKDGREIIINASRYMPDGLNVAPDWKDWKKISESSNSDEPLEVKTKAGKKVDPKDVKVGAKTGDTKVDLAARTEAIKTQIGKMPTRQALATHVKETTGAELDVTKPVKELNEIALKELLKVEDKA